jgi:predicted phage terminase large subunit-like protein
MEQEPGASAKNVIDYYKRTVLAGYSFTGIKTDKNKEVRARPVASQAEAKNIKVFKAYWNDAFLSELEAFPTKGVHDDVIDALDGAMEQLFFRTAQAHVDYAQALMRARGKQ